MKKFTFAFVLLFTVPSTVFSQNVYSDFRKKAKEDFISFKDESAQDYYNFRAKVNSEYSQFMRNAWEEYEAFSPVKREVEPYVPPVVLPEEDRNKEVKSEPVIIDEVIEIPQPDPELITPPEPVIPVLELPEIEEEELVIVNEDVKIKDGKLHINPLAVPKSETATVSFFGGEYKIRRGLKDKCLLENTRESDVADMWTELSKPQYQNMIYDCQKMREEMQMGDWAFVKFCESVSMAIYDAEHPNERAVLQAFLLIQTGVSATLGRDESKRLHVLIEPACNVYDRQSWSVGTRKMYLFDDVEVKRMNIFNRKFPGGQPIRLDETKITLFKEDWGETRKLASDFYDVSVKINVNKNRVDFYGTYPSPYLKFDSSSRWRFYALPPLDEGLQSAIYPRIREYTKGLEDYVTACVILNFVQTAFPYEYDNKVWGYDRAFFAEETLFYPYCDCEDRSILFYRMIKDILGLDVVLIYYPGHLATAVHFNEEVDGDYFMLDGKRYTVCDPTFINAPVGRTMTGFEGVGAKILKVD